MIASHNLFALILVILATLQLSTQKTFPRLPLEVVQYMGSRAMRFHHFLWHNIRESWPLLDADTQEAIRELGWAPPRPSLTYDQNNQSKPELHNGSGEDFLYMHRQMVRKVNEILKSVGGPYQKVVGWSKFPAPDDEDYPVPCAYDIPGVPDFTQLVAEIKSFAYYRDVIKPNDEELRNSTILANLTLGELGSRLEYEVHQRMHLRFSMKTPYGLRLSRVDEPAPNVTERWDELSYQWLGDPYSAHVNPVFWRIHGYVEDRLEQWKTAHGLDEIPWNNTWEGGPKANLDSLFEASLRSLNGTNGDGEGRLLEEEMHEHGDMKTMEEVAKIFLKGTGGKESMMYRTVKVQNGDD